MTDQEIFNWLIVKEYVDTNGMPLKCFYCGCKEHNIIGVDYIDHQPSETKIQCTGCSKFYGYWGYGNWEMDISIYVNAIPALSRIVKLNELCQK